MPCLHRPFTGDVRPFGSCRGTTVVQNLRGGFVVECKESRIGKAPVPIPQGVEVKRDGYHFTVKVDYDVD